MVCMVISKSAFGSRELGFGSRRKNLQICLLLDIESLFYFQNICFQVMDLDATINSHPIIQPVEHPDQITEIFDTISYSKGAAVLR